MKIEEKAVASDVNEDDKKYCLRDNRMVQAKVNVAKPMIVALFIYYSMLGFALARRLVRSAIRPATFALCVCVSMPSFTAIACLALTTSLSLAIYSAELQIKY